jgi:hypothetical protein
VALLDAVVALLAVLFAAALDLRLAAGLFGCAVVEEVSGGVI